MMGIKLILPMTTAIMNLFLMLMKIDRQTDGRTDERTDGRTDGRTD